MTRDTSVDSVQPQMANLARSFAARQIALPDGAVVAVRECGPRAARPAVVLLHGISSGSASWLAVATALADRHQAIAWDAPGYGDSTPLDAAAPAAEDYAARLAALVDALALDEIILVGHSLGALIAAAYARGAGAGRVSRLVLISPAGGYGQPDRVAESRRVRAQRRDALASLGVEGLAQDIAQRLLSPRADAAARAWVKWNTARLHPGGYLQAVEMLCASDLGAGTPLRTPVQVLCGDADVVTPPASCRAWAIRLGASFELIEHAGHASPIEQPGAVARRICATAHQPSGDIQHA